ncbi:hypothetical protein I6F15_00320 [Bradyrhizobium sp. BRP14]|nr:hypothetical protein [Bradyrhizobium sp. BRP14]
MSKIVAPAVHDDHPERQLECQRAIDCEFQALTGIAERAGWSWQEIALALMDLTEEYVMEMRLNAQPERGTTPARPDPRMLH